MLVRPVIWSRLSPRIRSAAGLQETIRPLTSCTTTPSIIVSSRSFRAASDVASATSASFSGVMSSCVPVMRSGLPSSSHSTICPRSRTQTQRPSLCRIRQAMS